MDLHSAQVQGFFDIPVDNLYASPIFELDIKERFADHIGELVVVSPDVGGVARARELAQRVGVDLAVVDKRRDAPGVVSAMSIIGGVEGRRCILVDDICDSAGTLCMAAKLLMDHGAVEVHGYLTHGVMSNSATQRIGNSVLRSVVVTDTIRPSTHVLESSKVRVCSTAPLFARAMLNIASGTSVSSLFEAENIRWLFSGKKLPLLVEKGQSNSE